MNLFGVSCCCGGNCVSPEQQPIRPDLFCKSSGGCSGGEPRIAIENTHYLVDFRTFASQSQIAQELMQFWDYLTVGERVYQRAIYMVDYSGINEDGDWVYTRRATADGTNVEVIISQEFYTTTNAPTGMVAAGDGTNYYYSNAFVKSILIYKEINGKTYAHKLVGRKKSPYDTLQFCPSADHEYTNVNVIWSIEGYTARVECKLQIYHRRWSLDTVDYCTVSTEGFTNCTDYNGNPANGEYTGTITKLPMDDLGLFGIHPSYPAVIPNLGDARMTMIAGMTLHGDIWPATSPADYTQTIAVSTSMPWRFCLVDSTTVNWNYHLQAQINWNQVWNDYPSQQTDPYKYLTIGSTFTFNLSPCIAGGYWDEVHTYTLNFLRDNIGTIYDGINVDWFCDLAPGTVSLTI